MADIRINALATTAASTASDDFVAVDGSANGTRKLSAYSPTFGGNLTVSGTISSNGVVDFAVNANSTQVFTIQNTSTGVSAATRFTMVAGTSSGSIQLYGSGNSTPNILQFASPSSQKWLNNGAEVMSLSSAGNLTVSGTGTSDFSGNVRLANTKAIYAYTFAGATGALISSSASDNLNVGQNNANWAALNLYGGTGNVDVYSGATGFVARFNTNGNALFGTTTDSGNGKLQLATHTTSAGGIGLGTIASLYTSGGGSVRLESNLGYTGFTFDNGGLGTSGARILSLYGALTVSSNGANSFYLQTGGTTALTLDSSQRCILAGALRLNNAYTAGAPTATGYVTIQDSAGNTYKVLVGT